MKAAALKISPLVACALFGLASCSSGPGDNPGTFGETGGAAADAIARGGEMNSAETLATGASSGEMMRATIFIIAKREATARQRQVATMHAHAAVAHLAQRKKSKRSPRYIAVDTVRDDRTAPRAQKSVMIWDTESSQVVGKDVYDVQTTPPVGSTARFETYSAEYVGNGS